MKTAISALLALTTLIAAAHTSAQEQSLSRPSHSANSFHLRGVLISESGRSALVNGALVREGDRIAGAEVLAITETGVRVLIGSEELTVPVGGNAIELRSPGAILEITRNSAQRAESAMHVRAVGSAPQQSSSLSPIQRAEMQTHVVRRGESLSIIAERYLRNDTTIEQMMMALFDINPLAFDGNINRLRAGVVLRLPNDNDKQKYTSASAAAAVGQHALKWLDRSTERPDRPQLQPQEFKIVKSGETLSMIAKNALREGATMNQMMMAIFRSNPQAFGDNINVLRAGATLHIPVDDEIDMLSPDGATAEVARHTDAWRSGRRQQAMSAPERSSADVNAIAHVGAD